MLCIAEASVAKLGVARAAAAARRKHPHYVRRGRSDRAASTSRKPEAVLLDLALDVLRVVRVLPVWRVVLCLAWCGCVLPVPPGGWWGCFVAVGYWVWLAYI